MSQDICYNETSHHEWVSQGFEEAPFDDKKLNFCHYRSQGFIHALNQLATLDTTAVCLSHIYGESGSGKTSCLKSFQKMPSNYLQVYLPTAEGLSPINLLKTLFFHFKCNTRIVRKPCTEYIVNLAKTISKQNLRLRIIIDEAHTLPEKTFHIIQQLASVQPTGSHIQFILASHHSIDSLHKNVSWENFRIKTIQLANLTFPETQKYIKLSLTRAKKEVFQPQIPQETMEKIHKLSQGNIRRINQVAARHLLKHINTCKPKNLDSKAQVLSDSFDRQSLLKSSLVILLGYAAARFYFVPLFQKNLPTQKGIQVVAALDQQVDGVTEVSPEVIIARAEKNLEKLAYKIQNTPANAQVTQANAQVENLSLHSEAKSSSKAVKIEATTVEAVEATSTGGPGEKKALHEMNQISDPAVSITSESTAETNTETSKPDVELSTQAIATNDDVQAVAANTETAVEPVATTISATETPIQGTETRIANHSGSDGFFIQLAASSENETHESFCQKHGLCSEAKLIDYITERNNKPVRIFVLGPFNDASTAKSAMQSLPAKVLQNKPWIKSMQSVTKDMGTDN